MGIIDAAPIDHTLRKPVAYYSWEKANADRDAYLATQPHMSYEECFQVVDVVGPGK
jgi:hypothetical protein